MLLIILDTCSLDRSFARSGRGGGYLPVSIVLGSGTSFEMKMLSLARTSKTGQLSRHMKRNDILEMTLLLCYKIKQTGRLFIKEDDCIYVYIYSTILHFN